MTTTTTTKTPYEAYADYNKAERIAADAYQKYWIDKFLAHGFTMTPGNFGEVEFAATINGEQVHVRVDIYARRSRAVWITTRVPATSVTLAPIHRNADYRFFYSESGFQKWLTALQRGQLW